MLDVAGKEYVAKEAGGVGEGEEEEEGGLEPHKLQELEEEEEEVRVVTTAAAAGGDYTDLMKKMDITACTVIVPKVPDT